MRVKHKVLVAAALLFGVLLLVVLYLSAHNVAVLNPAGEIANKQRNLIIFTVLLSLIVVLPVYIMLFSFAYKYREGNKQAKYSPDWDHHRLAEITWWAVPGVIILILAGVTWKSSHDLDPFKSLNSSVKPINVQVVALQWKWLFIYPEQNIASVNYLQFPVNTPINFQITADAPMNSFWIPQLGGQIYAMSGMSTQLHLQASKIGNYRGSSANISGSGFADMNFVARASTSNDFEQWLANTRGSQSSLSFEQYSELAKPGTHAVAYYASSEQGLYDLVVNKYAHGSHHSVDHQHSNYNGASE